MKSQTKLFWRASLTLVVAGVGVGIFGLPYVFAQSGVALGLVHLAVLGAVNMFAMVLLADLIVGTKGHPRITGIVERYLGEPYKWVAMALTFGSGWAALLAYMLVGGSFAYALLNPVIGGGEVVYQVGFWAVGSLLVLGGLGFIGKLESLFALVLAGLFVVIVAGAGVQADVGNLVYVDVRQWFTPFGVVLFALGGSAAVPEMAEMLGRYKGRLRKAVVTGSLLMMGIYALFAGAVVAVTGQATTERAIEGLAGAMGHWVLVVGGLAAFFATFTSFLLFGMSIHQSLMNDFRWRYVRGWALAVVVPLALFLLGARDFIQVVGWSGAVLSGLTGLLLIATYAHAKNDPRLPKRHFHLPRTPLFLCALVFLLGIVVTLVRLF